MTSRTALYLFQRELMVRRVASRFVEAMEHTSPEALRDYLREHPGADKSKHTVKKPERAEPSKDKPEEKSEGKGHGDSHGEGKSWKDRLKSLSDKAKTFVKEAPTAVKSFIEDEGYRKKAVSSAKETLKNLPKKTFEAAKHSIKHEVEEFKTAAEGVHTVLKGGKMTKEQKHAVKVVAFDVALTVAVAAVSGGLAAGAKGLATKSASVFAHSMAKKIALNTVTHGLGNVVTVEELGHFGHGVAHLFRHAADEKKKPDDRDLMTAYITKLVSDEMERISPEMLAEAVEEAAKGEG